MPSPGKEEVAETVSKRLFPQSPAFPGNRRKRVRPRDWLRPRERNPLLLLPLQASPQSLHRQEWCLYHQGALLLAADLHSRPSPPQTSERKREREKRVRRRLRERERRLEQRSRLKRRWRRGRTLCRNTFLLLHCRLALSRGGSALLPEGSSARHLLQELSSWAEGEEEEE